MTVLDISPAVTARQATPRTPAATTGPRQSPCATDPNPDRWTDLPPVRIKGRTNPAYAQRKAELGKVCSTCPTQARCLSDALTFGLLFDVQGIWSGTDEFDRHDLRNALELPDPAGEMSDTERLHFRARYLAAKTDLTYAAIAKELGVSPMAVTRMLDERDPETVPRRAQRSA